ncbi:hypothetical protein PX52LOC_04794 [Limnoglobus roseus]|uniref:Protein kinase domain-containing protein n=2 Tax=Limnoglobus roseus TaxID=2598579 RepID=A0A5C1AIF3_9BACT|nr:hypothetical protein PX52LOC_04794 [Limnoglobus roseus]
MRAEDQPNTLTTPFEQVVSLCTAFTWEYQHDTKPAIDSYLNRVGADAQPTLLRNLLAIEIEWRRAAGEQPQLDDYLARFPQFTGLLREAFLQQSQVYHPDGPQTAPEAPPVTWDQQQSRAYRHDRPSTLASPPAAVKVPAASRLGDYLLLRELGRGGMGVVYEAVHQSRGNHVALKTLPAANGAALHRFKREFRTLADINHPNLIGLHTLEADGCHWFFTMDLIQGEDFFSFVRPSGVLDEPRLRSALAQLVMGVLALHGRNIVHRDLKPSNVMVNPEGRVLLLDFGLALEFAGNAATTGAEIAGTPGYMAPEQAGAGAITPACDWYAVGVMLYEALTGRLPFSGDPLKVLRKKQNLDPPSLADVPDLPDDLAELAMRLLARAPDQRPDALAIAKVIASHAAVRSGAVAAGWHLVGRGEHLEALKDAYRTFQQQREPITAFIRGRSGEGKSTLAEHFLQTLRHDPDLVVLSARCYDRESVPFKALDNLIDALATFLRTLPHEEAARVMPADIGVLCQVFSVLHRVDVVAQAPRVNLGNLDEPQIRDRAFTALRELLCGLSQDRPLIAFVDDLQWGDADSAEVLFTVLRPPQAPRLLFLGSYRSDETETSPFLRKWHELNRKHDVALGHREVTVSPLGMEECTELVLSLLGKDTPAIRLRAAQMAAETGGNPYLLIELVGCFDPETDSFQPLEMPELLARKMARLPAEAGSLLNVVAVSGQALSLAEASRTAGHALAPVATIMHMRNERLVRLVGPEENLLVDTYHDRVRETVLGQMGPESRRTIHRTLAEVIEAEGGGASAELVVALERGEKGREDEGRAVPRVYDLAYHYDAAGESRRAWAYALLAGEQARRQFALEVAAEQFAIARRNAESASAAIRFRICEGRGEALMLLGRYWEASQELDGAVALTNQPIEQARIEALQGELAFKQCAINESLVVYERALRRLGQWVPRSSIGWLSGLFHETFIQALHTLFPSRLHAKSPSEQSALVVRIFDRVSETYWFHNTVKYIWAHLSAMNRAEQIPPGRALAFNYSHHAVMMNIVGWNSRGANYVNRSLDLSRKQNDLWGLGHGYNYSGLALYASGRFEEAIARFDEAIALIGGMGDLWELYVAYYHKGLCLYRQGKLREASEEARRLFQSSVRTGEDNLSYAALELWARLTQGNLPFEQLRSCCRPRPDDILATSYGLMAEGHWHLFHGRTLDAMRVHERAFELVKKNLVIVFHTMPVLTSLTAALRRHADAVDQANKGRGKPFRRRAIRLARWATWFARFVPGDRPQALRERSLLLAADGKLKEALSFADESCAVAEKQKATYEQAQSSVVRGRIALRLKLPQAPAQIQAAEAAMESIERPVPELAARRPKTLE